jgi:DNA uptake protein ComE-like DNA-binding protein
MKEFIKDYFTFHKAERNGIIVLLFILSVLLFVLSILHAFVPDTPQDFSSFNAIVAELEKAKTMVSIPAQQEAYSDNKESASIEPKSSAPINRFPFNPNQLSSEKWSQLGLSAKQINVIKHYEEKGGHFYKKEDLKKIYGINENLYKELEPFITLPEKNAKNDSGSKKSWEPKTVLFDKQTPKVESKMSEATVELNSADTAKLKKLKGIGSGFAKRIMNYREKLGGFVSLNQLYEIWGLDSFVVKSILPQISLNTAMVRKIPLNHCNVSDLKKHPYLTYNIANNIVLYRDRHGDFSSLQDIKQAVLVNEELFRKIAPYLTLD